ncbi:uncharacterized protein LOC125233834 isoform X2 [Leguminivora glycinivorella]|uniref:uncharacterized protein LOC125233834 isoform X2 n=1 Tax=Leguminivora glycinivorella TaxID=1035111 RepID=UPI002010C2D2|nr:uncharacterized protein LOC125233834 isoform X2 [Leguminivora glycinivorella]
MEDLLKSQIQDSCRLAMPEGLKDLMADISREVLRAQPENLYQFIADYLSSLLVAREHLFVAARVCDDVCTNTCCADLEAELRALSLSEEDLETSLKIISEYFSSGDVKEGNLLQKLIRKTSINPKAYPAVQDAVRRAFLRHQLNKSTQVESSSTDSELDETSLAAKHTLKIYKKAAESPDINYDCVASKIQAAYRAYNVRRLRKATNKPPSKKKEVVKDESGDKVRFQVKSEPLVADFVHPKRCASKCSSVSLAGSFLSLPLYKPYSIGQPSDITEVDEVCEKETENANFDYVTNELRNPKVQYDPNKDKKGLESIEDKKEVENSKGKKTISFHNLPRVLELDDDDNDSNDVSDEADEADYDSEVAEDVLKEFDEDYGHDIVQEDTVVSELQGDEMEPSENSTEDDVDEVQLNEMEVVPRNRNDDDNDYDGDIASATDHFDGDIDEENEEERRGSEEIRVDSDSDDPEKTV